MRRSRTRIWLGIVFAQVANCDVRVDLQPFHGKVAEGCRWPRCYETARQPQCQWRGIGRRSLLVVQRNRQAVQVFKDGHVQAIEFHDLDGNPERCYVRSKVLPSMRKTEPYRARICLFRDGMVEVAYCVCTAGLAGCCNHIAGLLDALEEFVRLGLREEPESPTSRLCKWNKPRSKKVAPCKVADIRLSQSQFLKEKRSRGPKAVYNPSLPTSDWFTPQRLPN